MKATLEKQLWKCPKDIWFTFLTLKSLFLKRKLEENSQTRNMARKMMMLKNKATPVGMSKIIDGESKGRVSWENELVEENVPNSG